MTEEEYDDLRAEYAEQAWIEKQERRGRQVIACHNCGRECGFQIPDSHDSPGYPAGKGEDFQDRDGNWHCSDACLAETEAERAREEADAAENE